MKIIRFLLNNEIKYGALEGTKIKLIDGDVFSTYSVTDALADVDQVKILPPVNPTKIVCVGLNYKDHQIEMNEFTDDFPKLFIKPSTAVIANGESIIKPKDIDRIDFEGELAVVIKKTAKNVEDWQQYVLGYTCLNDVTAREIQKKDGQWTRAKSFDTFAPIGPIIETDINPNNLEIKTYVNGQIKQSANTSQLIWDVGFLVKEISKIMTLLPGDVITTGTPSGTGRLEINDRVDVEIENIGTLTNYLKQEEGS